MIGTMVATSLRNLSRDRVAMALSFLLPVAFFSIFALVFGSSGPSSTSRIEVAVVDLDQSDASRRLIDQLGQNNSLRLVSQGKSGQPLNRDGARSLVSNGRAPVAVIVPAGFGEHFGEFVGERPAVELLADKSDPVASQMVGGLLQAAAMTAAPDLLARRGFEMFEKMGAVITPEQQRLIESFGAYWKSQQASATQPASQATLSKDAKTASWTPVPVNVVDVLGAQDKSPAVSFYAAGTAVMFLLFMASGAGGALLDDEERGVLDRLLSSRLGMGRLLAANWIYITTLCVIQVTIMFIWGSLVFGIKLWTAQHLAGFAAMTIATAAAAGGFGLVFATACRSRAQLHGISTIVILIMSAVGGSMFPRFLMQDWMRKIGLATFNAWALDGYQKVFWYEKRVPELWPQLLVLSSLTLVFLVTARILARRWEAN